MGTVLLWIGLSALFWTKGFMSIEDGAIAWSWLAVGVLLILSAMNHAAEHANRYADICAIAEDLKRLVEKDKRTSYKPTPSWELPLDKERALVEPPAATTATSRVSETAPAARWAGRWAWKLFRSLRRSQ